MGHPDTKIQLSFKVKLVEATPIYFGYTQLMFWELFRASPYFSDLNYNPEVFFRWTLQDAPEQWIDFSPIEHESNGQGGVNERSWNRAYVRYHAQSHLTGRENVYWSAKAWVPFIINPNNSDIAKYRGIWELNISLSDFLGSYFDEDDLTLRLYPGGAIYINPALGGQELTFRAKARDRKLLPLFVFQVFHGYAENLLNYNESRLGLRAGLGF